VRDTYRELQVRKLHHFSRTCHASHNVFSWSGPRVGSKLNMSLLKGLAERQDDPQRCRTSLVMIHSAQFCGMKILRIPGSPRSTTSEPIRLSTCHSLSTSESQRASLLERYCKQDNTLRTKSSSNCPHGTLLQLKPLPVLDQCTLIHEESHPSSLVHFP
jgi:hypothetical protein